MAGPSLTIEQVLSLLAESPTRIAGSTAGLSLSQLHSNPRPDEWSANDVLAHLRSCADVWGKCIAVIIAENKPTIRAVNPRTWIRRTTYLEAEFWSSLGAFASQRSDLLAIFEPLAPEGWSRVATVTGAGRVIERSVLSYAEWMASHEQTHVKQIERIAEALRI